MMRSRNARVGARCKEKTEEKAILTYFRILMRQSRLLSTHLTAKMPTHTACPHTPTHRALASVQQTEARRSQRTHDEIQGCSGCGPTGCTDLVASRRTSAVVERQNACCNTVSRGVYSTLCCYETAK